MHPKAIHTLILFIVACWSVCGVELRLYSPTSKYDRIVFPVDNDEPMFNYYNETSSTTSTTSTTTTSSSSITTTESPLNKTSMASEEVHPLKNISSITTTTATTTELPNLDNRILLDTDAACQPGFSLRAGRCRKSA
ncbi:zinc metalloproteinase nas-14 [Drosophila grimshawi]|uniref:GH21014 n=1 Tax=Drosophila grimshawi TaxID=7222 RepID=B4J556_DROGR|nr:zinc metalloproteinase nas-14 [Drosophila grimshawi]EDW00682.1 GH21014 [Drosophila grimshawi]